MVRRRGARRAAGALLGLLAACGIGLPRAPGALGAAAAGPEVALPPDDECLRDGGVADHCAVSALQLRARVAEAAASNVAPLEADACRASALARQLREQAPACVQACPQLCNAFLPAAATLQRGAAQSSEEDCALRSRLACAAEASNAAACAPLLDHAPAAYGVRVRELLEASAAACPAGAGRAGGGAQRLPAAAPVVGEGAEAARAALLGRRDARGGSIADTLESTMGRKLEDWRCEEQPDGQKCVNSTSLIHCVDGKRIEGSETDCPKLMGTSSLCLTGGVGVMRNFCDDPFCRTGHAYDGDAMYCHNDMVVRCTGADQPELLDPCMDVTERNESGCDVTTRYMCLNLGSPTCEIRDKVAQCDGK